MNLAEWREKHVYEGELPSGLAIKLKRVNLMDIMVGGKIPTTMHETVEQIQNRGFRMADFNEFASAINLVVRCAMLAPELSPEGQPGDETHLSLDEMSYDDRLYIFNVVNEGVIALRPFRGQPQGDVESGTDGGEIRTEAIGDGGDHR